jgi:hypothetical protein
MDNTKASMILLPLACLPGQSGSSNSLSFATMQVYGLCLRQVTSFQAPDNVDNPIVIIGDGQEVFYRRPRANSTPKGARIFPVRSCSARDLVNRRRHLEGCRNASTTR